jgi:uncharacterized protein YndB with AHSA1/START domain
MPPASDSLTATGFTLDRATNSIRMTRDFAADCEAVFAAWTEPRQVERWWDPAGEPLLRCEIDLRVGGRFAFETRSHPEMPFTGVYREITPPERLVFEAMNSVGLVALSRADAGTRMIVEISCSTPEQLEQFIAMGVHLGTSRTLDNLVRHVDR